MFKFNSNAVSAVKAVSILLMVVGHSGCPSWLQDYLAMFRMPIFFTMSGYCFKLKYLNDAKTFVKKRFTGIWWPYVKWALIFLALHNVFFHLNIYSGVYGFHGFVSHLYGWQEFALRAVKAFGMLQTEQLLGGYWFLRELFIASLLGYVAIRYLRKFKYSATIVLLLLFTTAFVSQHIVKVPVITARTWMATFFFLFGHQWRTNEEEGGVMSRFDSLDMRRQMAVVAALALGVKGFQLMAGSMTMNELTFSNSAPYLGAAICGVVMATYVCRWIVADGSSIATRFLTFTGRHTFEVLTWHMICFKLVSLVVIAIYGLQPERLATFPVIHTYELQADGVQVSWTLWWVVYWMVGSAIPIAWQWFRLRGGREKRRY